LLGFLVLGPLGLAEAIPLSLYMQIMGMAFVLVTVLVGLFKTEIPLSKSEEPEGLLEVYRGIFTILQLRHVRILSLILILYKFPFAVEQIFTLKVVELGFPKETSALISTMLMPLGFALPAMLSKYTQGDAPLNMVFKFYPFRVMFVLFMLFVVSVSPSSFDPLPKAYVLLYFFAMVLATVLQQAQFMGAMSFFARVSDPAIGGTYMTLLNTLSNLGGTWNQTALMMMVDRLGCKGKTCMLEIDGFYSASAVCLVVGVVCWLVFTPLSKRLTLLKLSEWRIRLVKSTAA